MILCQQNQVCIIITLHFKDESLVESVLKDNNWNVNFASQEVLQLMETCYCEYFETEYTG